MAVLAIFTGNNVTKYLYEALRKEVEVGEEEKRKKKVTERDICSYSTELYCTGSLLSTVWRFSH